MDWTGDKQHVWWGKVGQKEGVLKYEKARERFQQPETGTKRMEIKKQLEKGAGEVLASRSAPRGCPRLLTCAGKFKSKGLSLVTHVTTKGKLTAF